MRNLSVDDYEIMLKTVPNRWFSTYTRILGYLDIYWFKVWETENYQLVEEWNSKTNNYCYFKTQNIDKHLDKYYMYYSLDEHPTNKLKPIM